MSKHEHEHDHAHHEGAVHADDGHVHLGVVAATPSPAGKHNHYYSGKWEWTRWLVLGLGVLGVGLFAASFFVPWWKFWLYAPQYPKGLQIVISLTGMGGDVKEVDLLNHYIGMKHLEDAAPFERQIAGWGVGAIGLVLMALLLVSGRKLNKLIAIPAVSFPVVFLADSFYWLYKFGHDLDPKAPLKIGAFTPQMFGNGQIGQFGTFATPQLGFWLAVAGVVFVVAATFVRSRSVCAHCGHANECSTVCPRLLVLPKNDPPAEAHG